MNGAYILNSTLNEPWLGLRLSDSWAEAFRLWGLGGYELKGMQGLDSSFGIMRLKGRGGLTGLGLARLQVDLFGVLCIWAS